MRSAWLCACLLLPPVLGQGTEAATPAQTFSHGLLWRVSKPGVQPSYVFGTIHLADPRVLEVPDAALRALTRSKRYYTENYQGGAEAARFLEAAQFEDGRRLEPLIGADAYAEVLLILRRRNLPDETIARIKPWAALVNLTVTPEDYERVTLDQKVAALALGRKMRALALEGIEEQIAVFDGIPLDTQVALLRHALAHRDHFVGLIEPTIQAWMKRDLAGMVAVQNRTSARFPEMAAHYAVLFRSIVENRSIVMAHRLFMPLREGRAFIAVGATHLYGKRGLLALIAKQGYRVERIY